MHFHAFFLVEEPPAGAELDFSGDGSVLEDSGHGGEEVVIAGVHVVENHFGKGLKGVEGVQEVGECGALLGVAHGVEAGIGADFREHEGVGVSNRC